MDVAQESDTGRIISKLSHERDQLNERRAMLLAERDRLDAQLRDNDVAITGVHAGLVAVEKAEHEPQPALDPRGYAPAVRGIESPVRS